MYRDEVIAEVWRIRDEYVRQHGGSLDTIVADLKERQKTPFSKLVDRRGRHESAADAGPESGGNSGG